MPLIAILLYCWNGQSLWYAHTHCDGEGNGNPLQSSCLENPMDRGASQATVHGIVRVGHDLKTKPPPPPPPHIVNNAPYKRRIWYVNLPKLIDQTIIHPPTKYF